MLDAEPDIGIGRQVKHDLGRLHRPFHVWQIEQIAALEREARVAKRAGEKRLVAGREVVVARDRVSVGQQAIDQRAPDETRGAGDEAVHVDVVPV